MSEETSISRVRSSRPYDEHELGRNRMPEPDRGNDRSSAALWVTGLTALGLGALAWYYLGPDLIRYLKIRQM
jgi:hypothetical protein